MKRLGQVSAAKEASVINSSESYARVTNQSHINIHPCIKRGVTPELPLEHVALGHEREELLDAGTEVVEGLEHFRLRPGCGPRVGLDEAAVGVGGRL